MSEQLTQSKNDEISLSDLHKFKAFLDRNPHMHKDLLGYEKAGRKQGSRNKNKLEAGMLLEIEHPTDQPPVETISLNKAKELVKQQVPRKKPNLTEEEKQRRLDVLAAGREVAKKNREEKKRLAELEAIEKAKEITVKKYMVKAKPTPKPKKQIKLLSDSDEESEIPTESEPEEVILKKIKRKAKMLKKIDEQLQAPVPPVRRGLGLWRD